MILANLMFQKNPYYVSQGMTVLPKMVPVQQALIQTISSKMLKNHGTIVNFRLLINLNHYEFSCTIMEMDFFIS